MENELQTNEILSRFHLDYAALTEKQKADMADLRKIFRVTAQSVTLLCPPGRYQAEALTCLETSSMFAIKGLCKGG